VDEHTGGHYLDTGDGPVSVDPTAEEQQPAPAAPVVSTGRALERPVDAAWREYITHTQSCLQCGTSVFRCDAGNGLWDAYRAARS
jgi:hypothetical protein